MILTPHAIVGASLANMFPNDPVLGFSLAFISHYVLDLVPHIDYDADNFLNKLDKNTGTLKTIVKSTGSALHFLFIFSDFIFGLFLCILFFARDEKSAMITLIGIAGGVLPDFFQFLYFKYKKQPWIFFKKIHDKLHNIIEVKNEKFWGISFQFVLPVFVLLAYYLLLKK